MTLMRTASLLAALLLAACSGTSTPAPDSSGASTMTFTNPVYDKNFPDPGVLREGGTWFAYGTNNTAQNVPLLTSTDLVHWNETCCPRSAPGPHPATRGPPR